MRRKAKLRASRLLLCFALAAVACGQKNPLVGVYRASIVVDDAQARRAGLSPDDLKALHEASPQDLNLTLREDHTYAQGNQLSTVEGLWRKQDRFLLLTPKSVYVGGKKATGDIPDYMLEPLTMRIENGAIINGAPGMQTVFTKVPEK